MNDQALVHMKEEIQAIKSVQKEVKVEYLPLDLASFQSTTDFVRAFKEKGLPLHILINNAALYGLRYSKTSSPLPAAGETTF